MVYQCPYCRSQEESKGYCSRCGRPIEWGIAIWRKSNLYYNHALEMAQSRNLVTAISYLNKSILLNKYHVEARNLLGILYFEIGEIGEALKQWIISQSISKEDNLATGYLIQVKEHFKVIANYNEAVKGYNEALSHLKVGNKDVAIIRLKKSIQICPHFVKGRLLLAVVYIERKHYYKSREQLKKILEIDCSHGEANRYLKILNKEAIHPLEPYERTTLIKPVGSMKQSKQGERNVLLVKYFMYFIAGLMIMFLVEECLVIPSESKVYQDQIRHLEESESGLLEHMEVLSMNYEAQNDELVRYNQQLEEEIQWYERLVEQTYQKEQVNQAKSLLETYQYDQAAQILYYVVTDTLDEEQRREVEQLREQVYPRAMNQIYNESMKCYWKGNYVDAAELLERALMYAPDEVTEPKVLYYLGEVYRRLEEQDKCIRYYSTLVEQFPNTQEAKKAKKQLEVLDIR